MGARAGRGYRPGAMGDDAADLVRISGDGGVRTLTLHRPDRHNAQTPALWEALAEAGRTLSADPAVRCVVLHGAGPSFSSGIDLDEMRRPDGFVRRLAAHPAGDPDPMLPAIERAQESVRWIPRAPFPVIAAVHGAAVGAGSQLALAADLRIVAEDATFAVMEVTHGLIPDLGATWALPRLVGRERALDLVLTGRRFSGAEAVEMGLALRAVPADAVLEEARAYAERIAAAPREALAFAKAAVDVPDLDANLRLTAIGQAACVRASDRFGASDPA